MGRASRVVVGVGIAFSAAAGGCRGCANDHPYVPPAPEQIAVTRSDAGVAPAAAPAADAGRGVVAALVAPPGSTSWSVDGVTLEAGGRELVLATVADFDGDGKKDALAIVRPAALRPGAASGDLVFFHGGDDRPVAAEIASGPALSVQSSCAPWARLERLGSAAAYAEIGTTCARGAASRAVVVLRLPRAGGAGVPQIAFDAVVVDPLQAPKLTLDTELGDRDGDGLEDVTLRLTIDGEKGGAPATARLAFFDRPAGPSRDPEEPEASLRSLASAAATRATKPKDAAAVAAAQALVGQVRALYRAACAEGGAPRVTKIHGASAVSCGSSKALEDAAVAEVRVLAARGEALRAFAAAEVAQVSPATKTAAKSTELHKVLAEVAPPVTASVRTLRATVDRPRDHHPEWGPLAFEPSGKLLVRQGASVVRVDPESGDEQASDVPPWKDEVLSPDGKTRWLEAYHACEGVALHATFAQIADGDIDDILLPIAPRLGKTCSGRGEPAAAHPIAWGPRGLEAVVAGHPLLIKLDPSEATVLPAFLDEAAPMGSPRSPGKGAFALAVANGVLVRGRSTDARGGWTLVKSPDLEPYAELRHCTAADGAARIACVRKGTAVLATLP